jgi:hypothetical protein
MKIKFASTYGMANENLPCVMKMLMYFCDKEKDRKNLIDVKSLN